MEFRYKIETRTHSLLLESKVVGNRYELLSKAGEELRPAPASTEPLRAATQDQPQPRCYTVPRLGSGGFGSVVRARELSFGLPRAIKFLSHDEQPDSGAFQRELLAAGATPFKHLVPLTDYGEGTDINGQRYGYLVWQYVPGNTLRDFVHGLVSREDDILKDPVARRLAHDVLLGLVSDALCALIELHEAGLAHMDIKDTNILVYPEFPKDADTRTWLTADYRAFVIDLGGVQSLQGREAADRVRLVFTPNVFPRHLVASQELGYDPHTRTYSSERIASRAVGIDLSCLGATLRRLTVSLRGLWAHIFQGDASVLDGLIDRLIGETRHDPCDSAREMKRLFETIPLAAARGIFDSELLTDRSAGLRIRVGPHLVKAAPPLQRVVDHPAFQRLRYLQQLSFVGLVYPDGTHTRFAHSLRTFHLAKQFVMGLARKRAFRLLFDRSDIDRLLAAALLHDLGQYPLSHCLEDLRKIGDTPVAGQPEAFYLRVIKHDQELVQQMLGVTRGKTYSIATVLGEEGLASTDLDYLIQKRRREDDRGPVLNISRDIINGVIDVDRVSYLLHDSERTGVPYGAAIDVGAFVEGLTVKCDETAGRFVGSAGLGLEASAVSAAEAVLAAVHWMYRNVYWHHTNRAFMAAVKFVVQRLLQHNSFNFDEYVEETSWNQLNAEGYAVERLRQMYKPIQREGVNPLECVLQVETRVGYRRVLSLGYDARDDRQLDPATRERNHIYDGVVGGICPTVEEQLLDAIEGALPRDARARRGEILIDVPLKRRLYSRRQEKTDRGDTEAEVGRRGAVWVERRTALTRERLDWVELKDYSPLADTLGGMEDHSGRKIRIFFSENLLDRLKANPGWTRLESLVYDTVKGAFLPTAKSGASTTEQRDPSDRPNGSPGDNRG